jgi:hypothetical protein
LFLRIRFCFLRSLHNIVECKSSKRLCHLPGDGLKMIPTDPHRPHAKSRAGLILSTMGESYLCHCPHRGDHGIVRGGATGRRSAIGPIFLEFFGIFLESRQGSRLENRDRTFGFTDLSSPDRRIKQPNRRYRSRLIVLWLTL